MIFPAILEQTLDAYKEKLRLAEQWAPIIHLDVVGADDMHPPTPSLTEVGKLLTVSQRQFHVMDDLISSEAMSYVRENDYYFVDFEQFRMLKKEDVQKIGLLSTSIGLVLNPPTQPKELRVLEYIPQRILVLGVFPGRQGQSLIPETIQKIVELRQEYPDSEIIVDGGMNAQTLPQVVRAGADGAVVGSALWQVTDPAKEYQRFLDLFKRSAV